MATHAASAAHDVVREAVLVRALGVATATLLVIDAYVHFDDAGLYDIGTGAPLTQGSLFRAQASLAVVVAVALLVRPHWIVWAVAVVTAAGAAGAVFLYTYVDVGRLGPLPDMYEPTWALPGKAASAVAETVATALSVGGLVVALWSRRRHHEPQPAAMSPSPITRPRHEDNR